MNIQSAKGTSYLFIQRALNTILGLILLAFLGRTFTYEQMGVYGAIDICFRVCTIIAGLGLNYASSRYVPFLLASDNKELARRISVRILIFSMMSSFLFALVTYSFADMLSFILFSQSTYAPIFQVLAVLIFFSICGLTVSDLMKGLGFFGKLAVFRTIGQVIRVSLIIILILGGFGVAIVFFGWIVFYMLLVLFGVPLIYFFFQRLEYDREQNNIDIKMRSVMYFSFPLLGFWFAKFIAESIDQLLVLNMLGVDWLGIYTISISITMFLVTILGMPLISTLTPQMSAEEGKRRLSGMKRIIKRSTRYTALFYFPISLILAAMSPVAVFIIGGVAYTDAAAPISIICIGLSTYGLTCSLISSATAAGKTKFVFISFVIGVFVELVIGLTYIPTLSLIGAAISRSIGYIVTFLSLFVIMKRIISIDFDYSTIIRSYIAATASSSIVFVFITYFDPSIIIAILGLSIGFGGYFIFLLAFKTLTKDDILFVISVFPLAGKLLEPIRKRETLSRFFRKLLADK